MIRDRGLHGAVSGHAFSNMIYGFDPPSARAPDREHGRWCYRARRAASRGRDQILTYEQFHELEEEAKTELVATNLPGAHQ